MRRWQTAKGPGRPEGVMASEAESTMVDMKRGVYRRIYAGFLEGKRINHVSARSEMAFWRLLVIADDFGNFPADPALLRVKAFPRRQISTKAVGEILDELADPNPYGALIHRYKVGEDPYGHIIGWVDLQPGARNGKRYERYPADPHFQTGNAARGNPGASGCIQGNPVQTGKASAYQNQTRSLPDNHQNQTSAERKPLALAGGDGVHPQGLAGWLAGVGVEDPSLGRIVRAAGLLGYTQAQAEEQWRQCATAKAPIGALIERLNKALKIGRDDIGIGGTVAAATKFISQQRKNRGIAL